MFEPIPSKKYPGKFIGFKIDEQTYRQYSEDYLGFCFNCAYLNDSCEPDARAYQCQQCDEKKVYGIDECLIMGRMVLVD